MYCIWSYCSLTEDFNCPNCDAIFQVCVCVCAKSAAELKMSTLSESKAQ